MGLRTLSLSLEPPGRPEDWRIGLADMRRGLLSIAFGYLILFGGALCLGGLVGYCLWDAQGDVHGALPSRQKPESMSTILFAGALLFFVASLFSFGMILRGKWMCALSAPERFHARWFMFASLVCIFAGPALNFGTILMAESKKPASRSSKSRFDPAAWRKAIEEGKQGFAAFDTKSYVKLAGNAAALLGTVCFVLFLRAMALCCEDQGRARLGEFFLIFMTLLIGGVTVFLCKPEVLLDRPRLLIALGLGWLASVAWYLLVIFSTIDCISGEMERR